MLNPYGGQIYEIPLTTEHVQGIVFWTKNIGPFMKHLPEVKAMGYPFVVQHTINAYPPALESRVVDYKRTVACLRQIADEYGPHVAVWRYDPILLTSRMPEDWHRRTFEMLAKALQGSTDEVVVSFAQAYRKTERNVGQAAQEHDFEWHRYEQAHTGKAKELIGDLAAIARIYGITLKICSQPELKTADVEEARCIDAERLETIGSRLGKDDRKRQKGNRKECACHASKDIGDYDTCPHGCVYCYAVQNRDLALARYREHDPASPFLFPPQRFDPDKVALIASVRKANRNGKKVEGRTESGPAPEQRMLFNIE
jgi:hypothetical protein